MTAFPSTKLPPHPPGRANTLRLSEDHSGREDKRQEGDQIHVRFKRLILENSTDVENTLKFTLLERVPCRKRLYVKESKL